MTSSVHAESSSLPTPAYLPRKTTPSSLPDCAVNEPVDKTCSTPRSKRRKLKRPLTTELNTERATDESSASLTLESDTASNRDTLHATSSPILPSKTTSSNESTQEDTLRVPKKRKKPKESTHSASTSTATMRRIQREWKDAIQSGTAFDWYKSRPVKRNPNDDIAPPIESQYLWMGPLSMQQWWIWHFTFGGVVGSSYEHGLYHGRIILPRSYPAHPPRVQLLTASGRFVTQTDICLSASNFHPETWQPAVWNVRTLVEAVRLHMLTPSNEIGGVSASLDERRRLAHASRTFGLTLVHQGKRIVIDHQHMLQRGWMVESTSRDDQTVPECNGDAVQESKEEDTTGTKPDTTKPVVRQSRKAVDSLKVSKSNRSVSRSSRPSTLTRQHETTVSILMRAIVQFCQSPLRLLLVCFGIIYAIANRQ